jgi:predicted nucleotide-binding protein (sugar kinase/HSP70/actin superfamily)
VDRLRVKPVIKITGEFWAQTTEGDGNFNMFAFLEKEGAQLLVEPIATRIAYMMYVAKEGAKARADAEAPYRDPK